MPNDKDKYFEDLLDVEFSEEEIEDEEERQEEAEELEEETKDSDQEGKELSEEEQREKNKNAEEARKRRAREAKEKEEAEAQKGKEEESKKNETNVNVLGEQLVEFRKAYPDIDLAKLDEDKNFKRYIEGKLLGRKDFTELYEDYIDLMSSVSNKDSEEIKLRHQIKSEASTGSSRSDGETVPEVYSEEEFNALVAKMPTMRQSEIDKVWDKFQKSLKFYKK